MTIINQFSVTHTTAKPNRKIEYIVIHYSAGVSSKAGSAASLATYYRTTKTEVSSDYTVDDETVVQYNRDIKNSYTWHCGGSKYATKGGSLYGRCTNANSIGIEICSTNDTGEMTAANDTHYYFTDKAVANAVELVKTLMNTYEIPAERVIRHYDVNGKPCPGIIGWNADSGSEEKWQAFKQSLTQGTPKKILYCVQVGAFAKRENADNFLITVRKVFSNAFIAAKETSKGIKFCIQVGAFSKRDTAADFLRTIQKIFPNAFIVAKESK